MVRWPKTAWKVLEAFDKPVITAFSDGDAITRGGEAAFQSRIPGAKGQPHVTLKGGHRRKIALTTSSP